LKKIIVLITSVLTISAALLNCSPENKPSSNSEVSISLEEKAAQIHERVLTIDTHCDTPMLFERNDFDFGLRNDSPGSPSQVDLPRIIAGGLDAAFFAVFIRQGERSSQGNQQAKEETLQIFDRIHKAVIKNSETAQLAFSSEDAYHIEKRGKRAIYMGIENGYAIGTDLSLIQRYYDLGARYMTLCHTSNNDICDSSTDRKGPEHDGLSPFGEEVVEEMNRLGMMVDVSHISDQAFFDALEVTRAPVIASHSCARALCDNPRNLSDAMLKALAENGGVIQMCIMSAYVKKPDPYPERDEAMAELMDTYYGSKKLSKEEEVKALEAFQEINRKYPIQLATVAEVVDHIDHIVDLIGIDHAGIGTDFDGGGGVDGCNDVSEMGNITLELVRRGYTEEQIRKIWGGNLIRVFGDVERLRDQGRG
jgi:membrane dipeptidase